MIIKISYALVGGVNFALEKSWAVIEKLIKKYPQATWRRIVDLKNNKGLYIVEVI